MCLQCESEAASMPVKQVLLVIPALSGFSAINAVARFWGFLFWGGWGGGCACVDTPLLL